MAGNETMIDAPVTPAPIFAYRALRGIIFGSPETPSTSMNVQQGQKAVMPAKKSPTKTLQMERQVRLTPPQKRKRDSDAVLSPTKSCLKAPGAITPRRVMLKDITVTFKDARMSISPELSRKGAEVHTVESNKENQAPTQERTGTKTTLKPNTIGPKFTRPTVSEISAPKEGQQPVKKLAPAAEPTFSLEEYMAKTDGEMKKLIRYGRKMRDYGRKQEEENAKLQRLVEELQQENERLRRGSISRNDFPETVDASVLGTTKPVALQGQQQSSSHTTNSRGKPVSRSESRPNHEQTQFALDELLNLDRIRDIKPTHSTKPVQNNIPSTSKSKPKSTTSSDNSSSQHPTAFSNHSDPSSTVPSLEPPKQDPSIQAADMNQGSIRLASDRLAAARARIQKKAELRKSSLDCTAVGADAAASLNTYDKATSTTAIGARSGTGTRIGQPSSRDNSVLDWAAL